MTNIANMSATLTLSAWEFQNGLSQTYKDLETFESNVKSSNDRINQSASKANGLMGAGGARALQQVGFMIQDFSSQIETRGIAGAMGAITNNIQMLGSFAGPTGMAVSALGGAVLGIAIPAFIKWSGVISDTKKAADDATKSIQGMADQLNGASAFRRESMKQSPEAFQESQRQLKAEVEDRKKTVSSLSDQLEMQQKLAKSQEDQQRRLWGEAGGKNNAPDVRDWSTLGQNLSNWNPWTYGRYYGMGGQFGEQSHRAQSESIRKAVEKEMKDLQALEQRIDKENNLFKDVQQADADRDQRERQKKMAQEEADRLKKGVEEIERFRFNTRDKYGTAMQKLESSRSRERDELATKTQGLADQKDVLAMFDRQTKVELQRSKIDDWEQQLSKLGKDNGMSAGVDLNSADGIRAINQAISGSGENSFMKEQLELERKQLTELEQIARGGKEGQEAADRMKAPELGQVEALGYADDSNGGRWKREVAPPSIQSDATLGRAEPLGTMDREDPTRKALESKRANDAAATAQFKERMKVALEHKRLLEEIARKPVSKVVALSG